MTGYQSKRAAARDKLLDDDDTQVYQDHDDVLTIAYQSGYYDGKKAAQRPWAGLTDEEIMEIAFNFDVPSLVIRTVEFKLKENNT